MSRTRGGWDRIKREILVWLGREPRIRTELDLPVEVHGTTYGGAAIWPGALNARSVVYSLGVGEDLSFDLSLIATHGVVVHAFDPTPRSIDWVARQDLPPRFHFHPWAVADRDGVLELHPPSDPGHVSHRAVPTTGGGGDPVEARCRRVTSIAAELGHGRIDLLKVDIEGFEYNVLDDLLGSGPEVDQIVVEFHHRFEGIPVARTRTTLDRLKRAGYRVFHVSPRGHEVSLLHRRVPLTGSRGRS